MIEKKKCASREFKALMATLFLGAFNDNLFKTVVSLLILKDFVSDDQGILFLALTAALFALPYVLFSSIAGAFADRFAKTSNIKWLKGFEVLAMIVALVSFWLGSSFGPLIAVFLMGMQSALFSPSKYGLLPEMLETELISKGNGYTEFYTFLAIIVGTAVAGFVVQFDLGNPALPSFFIAVLGVVTSLFVGNSVAAGPGKSFSLDPVSPNLRAFKEIRRERGIYLCVLGNIYFFFIGSIFQLAVLIYAKQTLQVGDLQTSLILAALAIGIGLGSILAGKASEGRVELGLIPIGGFGLCAISVALSMLGWSYALSLVAIFLLGISGGLFIVPVSSYIQANSPPEKLGSYIAATNFLTFCGIIAAAAFFWFMGDVLQLSPTLMFLVLGGVSFLVSIYLIRLLPEMLSRCLNWVLLHFFYSMTKTGTRNIPNQGGALIVANHVSFIDAQLILAAVNRPIRFIMHRPIYEHPLINPIARINGAIPIAASDGKEAVEATLRHAAKLISEGELVGIFAEGKITRDGNLNEFRSGLETIMKHVTSPIIPVCLKGLWGSIFSFADGKPLRRLPKRIPYPVTIEFGEPLPHTSTAAEIREVVRGMLESFEPIHHEGHEVEE